MSILFGGGKMTQSDIILNIAKENNGIVTAKMLVDLNISRGMLIHLCNKGFLKRSARGVYILFDAFEDEFVNLQSRFQKGIFSLDTALFLHNLTDIRPVDISMMFPEEYNLTNVKDQGVKCKRSKLEVYNTGIIEVLSPYGNKISVYSAEKTLCDIVVTRANVDAQLISTAFRKYRDLENNDIPLLLKYAEMMKVEKKVITCLELK